MFCGEEREGVVSEGADVLGSKESEGARANSVLAEFTVADDVFDEYYCACASSSSRSRRTTAHYQH